MPVNTLHPQYESALSGWDRARDVLAGEGRLKARGSVYIPRMDSQTDAEFNAHVARAAFFNATARTHDGYLGLVFRRDPSLSLPPALRPLTTDLDLRGSDLVSYAKRVCSEVIALGRCGTLVEWNDVAGEPRPFVAFYEAENITNWRVARINGRMLPVLVVSRQVRSPGFSRSGPVRSPGFSRFRRASQVIRGTG